MASLIICSEEGLICAVAAGAFSLCFSKTMPLRVESSMVVVMESIPLEVSSSYFLVCASEDLASLAIDLSSVAVFSVVLVVCAVLTVCAGLLSFGSAGVTAAALVV